MALNDTISKDLETGIDIRSSKHGPQKTDPEAEMEKLGSEVKEMAQKILHHRATLWDQFNTTLASVIEAQRPVLLIESDPATYAVSNPGNYSLGFYSFLVFSLFSLFFLVLIGNKVE